LANWSISRHGGAWHPFIDYSAGIGECEFAHATSSVMPRSASADTASEELFRTAKQAEPSLRAQDQASFRVLLLLATILLVGCDPGMTVRQVNALVQSENAAVTSIPKISIEVKTTHELIGASWYDPRVIVTNSSDIAVAITRVELIAGGIVFQNEPHAEKHFPVILPLHNPVPIDVYFSFGNGVYLDKIFKNPANCESTIRPNMAPDWHVSRLHVGI
jgi:hypothetical protein